MFRFTLDELPLLFTTTGESMSLDSPNLPLSGEIEFYESSVHRRFLVEPETPLLRQTRRRSTLSTAGTALWDCSYVENWSILGDVAVLDNAVKTAVTPDGTTL